ncbi:hypothetical protein B0H13DRAFT_1881569 [Mycena leptocephala]|nr:hypothetical protein B0H13DRAFT_1881569 [Mycena leptocephala]
MQLVPVYRPLETGVSATCGNPGFVYGVIKAASPETLRDAVYGQGDVHLDFLKCSNRGQHCASDFRPLTRFQHHEIPKLIDHIQEVPLLGKFTSASRIVSSAGIAPTPSTASDGIPAYEILCGHGSWGEAEAGWDPQHFIEKYGGQNCGIVEGETQGKRDTTVAAFFQRFGVDSLWNGKGQTLQCWKLKMSQPTTSHNEQPRFQLMWKRKRKGDLCFSNALEDATLHVASRECETKKATCRTVNTRSHLACFIASRRRSLFEVSGLSEVDPDILHQAYIRALGQKFQDLKEILIEYKDIFRIKSESPHRGWLKLYNPIQFALWLMIVKAFRNCLNNNSKNILMRKARTAWLLSYRPIPIIKSLTRWFQDPENNLGEDIILQTPRRMDAQHYAVIHHPESKATAIPEAPKTSRRESSVQEERRQSPQGTPLCSPSSLKLVGHSGSEEKTQPENFLVDGEVELGNPVQVLLSRSGDGCGAGLSHEFYIALASNAELEEHLVSPVIEEGPSRVTSNRSPLELGNYAQMSYSEVRTLQPSAMAEGLKRPMSEADHLEDRPSLKSRKLVYCSLRHDFTTAFHCKRKQRKQQTRYLQPGPASMMDGPHCAKGDAIPPGHAWAFSGLGLDLGVDQSPSPFARLAEKRACGYFSSLSD